MGLFSFLGRRKPIGSLTVTLSPESSEASPRPQIQDLNSAEAEWLKTNLKIAHAMAGVYASAPEDVPLDPLLLDRLFAGWLANRPADEDPNVGINAIGIAYGQYLIDQLSMEWKLAVYPESTEIAAYVHKLSEQAGDAVVCPANLVAKRFERRETDFFVPLFRPMSRDITELREGQSAYPDS